MVLCHLSEILSLIMSRSRLNANTNSKKIKRSKDTLNPIYSVIIACEDKVSAPTYLNMVINDLKQNHSIRNESIVIAPHEHTDPKGVLDDLLKYKKDKITYKDFEHKWIVIDRDNNRPNGGGHNTQDFNDAILKSKSKKIEVAYANDSFELWYLLHFKYLQTPIMRDDIIKNLIKELKKLNEIKFRDLNRDNIKSKKISELIYVELLKLQNTAIRNSKRLLEYYGDDHNPESNNPSTNIHELIELLNGLKNN
ncbi:RloB [Campylobacter hyointestinalis]|nr:RloB [Campylobacter hyointestinalis]